MADDYAVARHREQITGSRRRRVLDFD